METGMFLPHLLYQSWANTILIGKCLLNKMKKKKKRKKESRPCFLWTEPEQIEVLFQANKIDLPAF